MIPTAQLKIFILTRHSKYISTNRPTWKAEIGEETSRPDYISVTWSSRYKRLDVHHDVLRVCASSKIAVIERNSGHDSHEGGV